MKDNLHDLLRLPDELEQLFDGMDPTAKKTFRHAFTDKVYQTTSTEAMQKHDEVISFRFDAFIWQPGRSRLVIHDDDLLILKNVLGALIPLLGVGPTYAKCVVIAVAVCTAWQAVKKSAVLVPQLAVVLALLSAAKPTGLKLSELAERLPDGENRTTDQIKKMLNELSMLRLKDGTHKPFVEQDATGKWHAMDV